MDSISVMAAGGLRSRMASLDVLANNLANAATNGYKSDREFYSLFSSEGAGADDTGDIAKMPSIDKKWTDFSQGVLQSTSNPLDLALSGTGFFAVNGPSGPLYTRNGSFQLSSKGELVTSDGYTVRSQGGGSIKVDHTAPIEVTPQGEVQQHGLPVGRLEVVTFADTNVLAKQGGTYFRNSSTTAKPTTATNVQVRQGQIENSNVQTPEAAVQLVGVMRQFEMLQKAVTVSADMGKKGIEEVARVTS